MASRTLLLSLVALALPLALGCGDPFVEAAASAASSSTSAGTGGAGGAGGGTTATATATATTSPATTTGSGPSCTSADACGDCMMPVCPELYCACLPGSACAELLSCVDAFGATPTSIQIQVCFGQNPSGISAFMLFGDCASEKCAASSCGNGLRDLPPCEVCAFSMCEADMNTCYAQKPCADLVACYSNCGPSDGSCLSACKGGVAAPVVAAADAIVACTKGPCSSPCGS